MLLCACAAPGFLVAAFGTTNDHEEQWHPAAAMAMVKFFTFIDILRECVIEHRPAARLFFIVIVGPKETKDFSS